MANRINVMAMIRNGSLEDIDDLMDVEVTKFEMKARTEREFGATRLDEPPAVTERRKKFKESRKNWELRREENRCNKFVRIA